MLDVTLNQSEGITESSYEETTDNMINKVAIYNSKNKKSVQYLIKTGSAHMEHFRILYLLKKEMEKKKQRIH